MSRVLFLCFIPKIPLDESEEHSVIELVKSYGEISKVLSITHSFPFKALLEVANVKSRASILKHLSFLNHPLGQLKIFPSKKKEINNFTANSLAASKSKCNTLSTTRQHNSGEAPDHGDASWYKHDQNPPLENSAEEVSAFRRPINSSNTDHKEDFLVKGNSDRPISRSINSFSFTAKSCWTQIHYAHQSKLTFNALQNLLGCFGNLKQLRFSPSHPFLFAEFENFSQARITAATLDNLQLFGSILRLKQMSAVDVMSQMTNFETFTEDSRKHRFTNHLNIRMNPLSSNLHFTNLPRELDPVVLYCLLSQVNEPLSITRSTSRTVPDSFMYLVQFPTSTQAAEVLSVLHNKVIQGKSIKVSFSHYHRSGACKNEHRINQTGEPL